MKRFATWIAERFGYAIVPKWRMNVLPQAEFLARFLAHLNVDCVLDVGANRGQFRDFLRLHAGYRGLIVSFEPLPAMASILDERARGDDRWIIEKYALGEADGIVKFNVMASDEFSSFLTPRHDEVRMFAAMNTVAEQVEVPLRRLDGVIGELMARHRFERAYLKLDTQGFDLPAVRGAGQFLGDIVGLQTEVSVVPIYEGAPQLVETLAFFKERGFEISGIFPNNPEHFPRMIEFDCHMINASRPV